jgi:hypothetical protein
VLDAPPGAAAGLLLGVWGGRVLHAHSSGVISSGVISSGVSASGEDMGFTARARHSTCAPCIVVAHGAAGGPRAAAPLPSETVRGGVQRMLGAAHAACSACRVLAMRKG